MDVRELDPAVLSHRPAPSRAAAPAPVDNLGMLLTGNAGVGAPMNALNQALGCREVERCLELQRAH